MDKVKPGGGLVPFGHYGCCGLQLLSLECSTWKPGKLPKGPCRYIPYTYMDPLG